MDHWTHFSYPQINPVALDLQFFQIHWYGLMYLFGFLMAWGLARYRAKRTAGWTRDQVADLVFYGSLGVLLGGRIGYVVFYGMGYWMEDIFYPLYFWKGGMSFHGGLLGVGFAMWLYARRHRRQYLDVSDFIAPMIAPGLGFGRIGNFINAELPGRVTDMPWGLIFPDGSVRHPSSLYQAGLEGPLLFVIVWYASRAPRPAGFVTGLFLMVYGLLRFLTEFFRQPDSHLGFVAFEWMTMGQLLSLPMVLGGLVLAALAFRSLRRAASSSGA